MSLRKVWIALGILLRAIPDLWYFFVTHWPGAFGNQLRYLHFKRRLKHLGRHVILDAGVHIVNPAYISIGDNTHIDRAVTLIAGPVLDDGRRIIRKENPAYRHQSGELHIGANIHIAPYAYLLALGGISIGDCSGIASGARVFSISHHYRNLADRNDLKLYRFSPRVLPEEQALILSPVVMEDNTALGLNSVVLPGSTIGQNSWVGVLSFVSGTIPPNVIASGCPAVIVKQRL